ncbi:MAG TPA: DHH family phosphoesterase [Mycobacteriales bacterium]|nr:DHH family phosphoesterase [Mycobacteriales bacterium]
MTAAPNLPEELWSHVVGTLAGAESIVLACHVAPDGDALGSMLAAGLALRALDRPVFCSFGDEPFRVPRAYAFLPGQDLLVPPAAIPGSPEVLVTFDTSSRDRLGRLAELVDSAGEVIVVDHHVRGDGFGRTRLVDDAAAATAVIVAELVDRLGVVLNADIACCLYTGLTTDTGSFKFVSTTPAVHELAARLLATGIRHELIARAVWDTNSFGCIGLLGTALSRARLEPEAAAGHGLVWTHTTAADLVRFGVGLDEIEGLIDLVRTTAEADVAVVCKGDRDGGFKVSARSKGAVDVGGVCAGLGGGGHRFAAGYTSADGLDATMDGLRQALAAAR